MTEKKYYSLRTSKGGKETAVYTGRQPRQAALKAANDGETDIYLRERGRRNKDGSYSLHHFKGSRKKVSAPSDRPSWLPSTVNKPSVKKVGVDRIERL